MRLAHGNGCNEFAKILMEIKDEWAVFKNGQPLQSQPWRNREGMFINLSDFLLRILHLIYKRSWILQENFCTDNYRPISLLSTINKIMKKLMYKQLIIFFNKNKILYEYQFGFQETSAKAMMVFTMWNQTYQVICYGKTMYMVLTWCIIC